MQVLVIGREEQGDQLLVMELMSYAACGNYGNALQAFLVEGETIGVVVTSRRGADAKRKRRERYETALQAAASSGKKSLVHYFWESDAMLNAVGGRLKQSLAAALTERTRGHAEITS